jgi:chromosome segregation ATPase
MCLEDYKDAEKAEQEHWTHQDEKIAELKSELEGKEDAWHEVEYQLKTEIAELKSNIEGLKVNRDYLFKENEQFRQIFLAYNRKNDATKEQIAALEKEINNLYMNNKKSLEHIWNNLKAVKIHFC